MYYTLKSWLHVISSLFNMTGPPGVRRHWWLMANWWISVDTELVLPPSRHRTKQARQLSMQSDVMTGHYDWPDSEVGGSVCSKKPGHSVRLHLCLMMIHIIAS
jgi:hypothetical protein